MQDWISAAGLRSIGIMPYSLDITDYGCGEMIEFKNVSFKYPDAEEYLLENISFKG